ncbi:hypothetical protein ABH935_003072 [Catenulispora sp. GAS73]|uniref:hypothetical protein n=1 Tax=Catenulispora sp. GAS73 TaxID=3156269 RepID=UPI003513C4DE
MLPALRVVAVLHALSFLLQPILAGLFLSGQDSAIDSHATNATIVVALCLVMTVLAFPAWRRGLVPRAAFTTSAALFVVEILQMGAGYGHVMWIHIPLGVIMMGGVAQLMPLIMRPYRPAAAESGAAVVAFPAAEAGE